MAKSTLQHWRVVSVTKNATSTRINTALSGYGWLVPSDCVGQLPRVGMGKNAVYWLVTLRIVRGNIVEVCEVRTAKTPFVDATIARLKRLANANSVAYTLRYCDPFTGKTTTYDGRSHLLWSELQPYGFDRTMEASIDHHLSLRCEFNVASKRITSITAPPLVIDAPTPSRSYAAMVRLIGKQIADAAELYGHDPRDVIRDAIQISQLISEVTP